MLKWIKRSQCVVEKSLLKDVVENGVAMKSTQQELSQLTGIPIKVSVGRPKKKAAPRKKPAAKK